MHYIQHVAKHFTFPSDPSILGDYGLFVYLYNCLRFEFVYCYMALDLFIDLFKKRQKFSNHKLDY
ncbi:hypothetical protein BLOT_006700 [Blomia tropicalis]|nr:hypothetical protein BLOT_006700 [Blomia tropicalis]